MIPEGKYLATVLGATLGETKKGAEQVVLEFGIDEGDQIGQRISSYRYFSDKALKYTIADLRTCGWTGDDLSNLSMLKGQVRIVVVHDTYEGKTSAKVKFINSLNGGVPPMAKDKAQSFAERMKSKVGAVESGADPRPEPPHDETEPPPF